MHTNVFNTLETWPFWTHTDNDSFYSLKAFLKIFCPQYRTVVIPEQQIKIDEYLLLLKGKVRFKVFVPIKREQYCKNNLHVTWKKYCQLTRFIPHTGADTVYPEANITLPKSLEDYTNPSKIVIIILEEFCNDG